MYKKRKEKLEVKVKIYARRENKGKRACYDS
jgi:hypothetical protein